MQRKKVSLLLNQQNFSVREFVKKNKKTKAFNYYKTQILELFTSTIHNKKIMFILNALKKYSQKNSKKLDFYFGMCYIINR